MQAAVLTGKEIQVQDVPIPQPQAGEVLVKTLVCGICGSDLQTYFHGEKLVELAHECGIPHPVDPALGIIMGHEFCAEIVDNNKLKGWKAGQRVCAMPSVLRPQSMDYLGFSNNLPGGFAQYMLLSEDKLFVVPNGLEPDVAALTEPLAVAIHGVNMAQMQQTDLPLVIGCGPIGLAVIAELKARNISPIVASDPSPHRRKMAQQLGADVVVDPESSCVYQHWTEHYFASGQGAGKRAGPPWVIFNCAGSPGIINQIVMQAPRLTRVMLLGLSLEPEKLHQAIASPKELRLQFVHGYSKQEFAFSLQSLAEGRVQLEAILSKRIGLQQIAAVMQELKQDPMLTKVLVDPWG